MSLISWTFFIRIYFIHRKRIHFMALTEQFACQASFFLIHARAGGHEWLFACVSVRVCVRVCVCVGKRLCVCARFDSYSEWSRTHVVAIKWLQ